MPPEQPAIAAARERGRAGDRRSRARVALVEGSRDRHHGDEGQVHDDGADGADARAGGIHVTVGGNIGAPLSAQVDRFDAGDAARRRDEQLSARADRDVPSVDCGDAELFARSSRSPSERRGLRRGEGADLREPGSATTGPWSTPTTRPCSSSRGDAPRRAAPFRARAPAPAGRERRSRTGWIVEPSRRRDASGWCRFDAIHLLGPHLVDDVMAAATVGDDRRARRRRR